MYGVEGSDVVVTRNPLRGPRRRDRYDLRGDGRWWHVEERWSGCRWVFVGSEILEDVDVEVAGGEIIE
ncbi:hypothetical protein EGH26_00065 [Halomicroarcula pellucida]|nr:hypothetical protein [Halomicroarcula pellucida]